MGLRSQRDGEPHATPVSSGALIAPGANGSAGIARSIIRSWKSSRQWSGSRASSLR